MINQNHYLMSKKLFLLVLWVMAAFIPAVAQDVQDTLTVYDGNATNGFVPVYGFYADAYTKCQMIMPASELSDLIDGTISKLTWYLASPAAAAWGGNFQIYISEVSQATCPSVGFLDISGATLVYEGPLDGTGATMEIVFTQGYTYGGGNLLISVYETETGSWKAATFSGTTVTGASVSNYSYSGFEDVSATYRDFLPKTTFTYAPIGGVVYHKPKHLAASDITTNSATITWDAGDDETSWGVEYKKAADEEWTSAGTVTEKTITLDALDNGVKYDVRVKSIYANGESGWVQISFSTFACEENDMGEVAYTLTDTYGDGWSNCKLQVYIAGTDVLVQELTMVDDPSTLDDKEITGTFKLCYGIDYDLVWVEGKFAYECGYVLTKPNGEIIAEFHGNGSSGSPTTGVLTTFQIHMEACPRPTDVTASNISYNSATITWEAGGDETSWGVEYKKAVDEEWISAGTVTEKTITLNALNNGVEYDVRVKGIYADGESKWAQISFATLAYEETDMTLTPYDVYTPNNVQTDSAENYRKLFDKDRSTKWCVDNSTGSWETIWVDFKSDVPFTPTGYTMTTGNDTQYWSGRNPKKWKIYAKAKESDSWTTIVDVTDGATAGLGSDDTTDYSFTIDGVNTGYQYFRFEVSEVCGRGGWQNNHYVFQLAELALNGVQVDPVDTLPFVPTPSLMSYPIHWYQLKINDKYVYYSGNMVSLTSTESTNDAYLWCFVELAPDSIVIYNKSEKQYMSYGVDLTLSPTASAINFVEPENKTGFYIYYYDGSTKYYHLEQPGYDILGESSQVAMAQLFNVTEVLVEEDHGEIKEAMLIPITAYTPNNANGNENEDYRKLFDKDKTTKWCVDNSTGSWETIWADFKCNVPFTPTGYTMTTGADTPNWPGRNPKKWKIYAKATLSDEWTTIVDVADGEAAGLGLDGTTDYNFTIDGLSQKYRYFRFEVSEVCGKGGWQNDHYVFQLAELLMYGYTLSAAVTGDANGDGTVDVNDVTTTINYILGKNPTPFDFDNANVNGDSKVDVMDVTLIINLILGIS